MLTQESAAEPALIMHYELCIMHYELCIMNYALKKGINILTIDKYCNIGL